MTIARGHPDAGVELPRIDATERAQPLEETFRRLRERAPVIHAVLDGGLEAWLVTRHAEGLRVLRDARFVKDLRRLPATGQGPAGRRYPEDTFVVEGRHVLNSDGAEHRRLRNAVANQLSATAIARLRPDIERIATEQVEVVAQSIAPDLLRDYARPVTERVMGRVLGLPEPVMLAAARLNRRLLVRDDPLSAPMRVAYTDLVDLIRKHTAERTAFPPDSVIGALWEGVGNGSVSRRELVSAVMMVIAAGISSTAVAISTGAATLASTATALKTALTDDGMARPVVDELLRRYPPFPFSPWRFAREPVDVSGVTIPAGAAVFVLITAANGDPRAMEHPEELLLDRDAPATPLTFGHGPHYCLGSQLARSEVEIALRILFTRFPDLRLSTPYEELHWTGLMFDRTITALPVVTGAGREESR